MNARGIAATCSTYGTLIDVYSKGGRRDDALSWLDMMLGQGVQPDEVTMVIVRVGWGLAEVTDTFPCEK